MRVPQQHFIGLSTGVSWTFGKVGFRKVVDYRPYQTQSEDLWAYAMSLREHQRWFLFAHDMEHRRMVNIALDRITHFEPSMLPFIDSDIDWDEYFDDVVGVTILDKPVERILLRFDAHTQPRAGSLGPFLWKSSGSR